MESIAQTNEHGPAPTCSIIIPTKDTLNYLKPCIDSVLASDDCDSLEIIVVDIESVETETIEYLESLRLVRNIQVLNWSNNYNISAINNLAVNKCRGEYVCFLNRHIEITDSQWITKLLAVAQLDDVGAVGCTLLCPDLSIQHAGIALDEKTIAQPIAAGEGRDFLAKQGITLPYVVDALTADCLVMRKALFLRMGGFNEVQLAESFIDVDLCLRLADKGLPVLCHPGVALTNYESVSSQSPEFSANRKRSFEEQAFMQYRWRIRLINHSFKSGMPSTTRDAALLNEKASASVAEISREAAASLYSRDRESPLSAEILHSMHSAETTLSETQDYFRGLQSEHKNLEAHAKRLEHAHALIENSIFWRMTYPLRLLRNSVTPGSNKPAQANEVRPLESTEHAASPKQQQQLEVPERETQPSQEPQLEEHPLEAQELEGQELEKKNLDNSAKAALDKFLASSQRIQLPETTSPQLSVVLVFYQQAHLSYLCLQALLEFADVSYELVIVDNNSIDGTTQLLDKIDNAKIIRNAENLGFVKAVNQAVEVATGEYVLLLNNDALIEKGTLSNALAVIAEDQSVGAVGAKIKLLDGSMQEAGSIIWKDGSCLGYGRGSSPDDYQFMFQRDVDYCSGAFLLFRRCTFNALNGFDLDYAPAYYEESDFCIRLQKQGQRIVYVPTSQITHYEFASSGGMEAAQKLQTEHRKVLCAKHADFLEKRLKNDGSSVLRARICNDFPNVLVIDDRVPHPSLGSGYPRCSNLLWELSKMDFNIGLYPLQFPDENWEDVYQTLPENIEVMLGSGRNGLQPFLEARKNYYQYVIVSRVHNMEFFNHCMNLNPGMLGEAKIIYDAEAVTASREILRMEFLGKAISIEEQKKLIDKELGQSKFAEKIVAVSQNEANIYNRYGNNNTVVLGHTIASDPGSKQFGERNGLLFVGALRDEGSPNVDSLLWFLVNVFPIIELAIPDIELNIVGDNSAPSMAPICKKNINFTGRLESIDEMYNKCRVFIAPTRFAAGIPHKVHEAASKGLPSVTTALLAEQLGWQDGGELLVGDTPEAYAAQCIRLYQDEGLWGDVRAAGLSAVSVDCSQETFRKNLAKLFS